jgi:hypothetical protein
VTIQKSWRSSIVRAPMIVALRAARSSSGYIRTWSSTGSMSVRIFACRAAASARVARSHSKALS